MRWLLLVAALLLLLGFARHIPSECAVGMYLPPMPGSPDADGQIISYRPDATTTFRLSYGTSPNKLSSWADGGDTGQSSLADTRDDFTLSGLTANTTYHWLIECSEDSIWKRGWRGQFKTLPSTGETLKIVFATDIHYPGGAINAADEHGVRASRTMKGMHLLASHVQDAHLYVDGGDTFNFHYRNAGGYVLSDDFGRSFGDESVTDSALTSDEEDGYAEARYSFVLRRMHFFLRFVSSIFVPGNHDVGGGFGGNWDYNNSHHWQLRTRPWVIAGNGVSVDLSNVTNGVFLASTHGIADQSGPWRWVDTNPDTGITEPTLGGANCGTRAATDDGNEWYVRTIDADSFYLAQTAADTGCTTSSGGSGDAKLLRGSDMRAASMAVIAEYLPLQNSVYPHGYGGATDEDHTMGPVLLSDHTLVITLNPFTFTGDTGFTTEPVRFPIDGRSNGASGGWTLGADQLAGVLAAIAEIQDGAGDYESVETLILVSHSQIGGFDTVGYSYARGSLCEVDTVCTVSGTDCVIDSQCTPNTCGAQDCTAAFAHPEMVSIQTAAAAMVARASGVAIWMGGHDHINAFGEKANTGVYYYKGGQLGDGSGGSADGEMEMRYDFDDDGIPAYRRHYCALNGSRCPAGTQNGMVERGTEHRGFSVIEVTPAAETVSTKTEVTIDYIINGYDDYPSLHGTSPSGFPFTIEGP